MSEKRDLKTTLLETALELIWLNSYECVSVEDICREAGAKKGSFYHHFGSKAALVEAALEFLWQSRLEGELTKAFAVGRTPAERLKEVAQLTYEQQLREQQRCGRVIGCPFCSIGSEKSAEAGVLREKACEILKRYKQYFQQAADDGVKLGEIAADARALTADRLFTYYVGALLQSRLQDSLEPLDGLYDAWAAIYRAGSFGESA